MGVWSTRWLLWRLGLLAFLTSVAVALFLWILGQEVDVVLAASGAFFLFGLFLLFVVRRILVQHIFKPIECLKRNLERLIKGEELELLHEGDESEGRGLKHHMEGIAKELKARDRRLLEQFRYTRQILDGQSSLVAVVGEGCVLDCNRRFLEFFGVPNKEAFNRRFERFFEVFIETDKPGYWKPQGSSCKEALGEILARGERIVKVMARGEEGCLSFALRVDEMRGARKEGYIFVLSDITELERYRETLEERVKAAIEESRLNERIMQEQARRGAMGELLVNIAHQWRQPLNNIGILAQDIEDMYRFGELNEKNLATGVQRIMGQIHALSETISKFTGFYDKKDIVAGFSVRESVERVAALAKAGFGHMEVGVRLDISPDLMINNNPHAFEEVLMALFVNSKEALERINRSGGEIALQALFDEDSRVLKLTFTDDAGGIPREILPKIFDPYFTTKFQSQGVGLGLFMVRNIVENRLYGSIEFENIERGVKFVLTIPSR